MPAELLGGRDSRRGLPAPRRMSAPCAIALPCAIVLALGNGHALAGAPGTAVAAIASPPPIAAQAAGPRSIEGLLGDRPCGAEIIAWLETQGAAPVALPLAADAPGVTAYAVSTDTLGRWLSLRLDTARVLAAARVEAATTIVVTWDDAVCVAAEETLPGPFSSEGVERFTDADLAALLGGGRNGLLYLWSPHMPFSVEGFAAIGEAAERANLSVTFLVDPSAHPDYVARIVAERSLPAEAALPLGSVDLLFRGLTNHAPSIQLYVEGELAGPVLSGVRTAEAYLDFIEGFRR